MDGLLKVGDVAALLGVHRQSVYKLAESGKIPHYKVRGAGLRFDPAEIRRWIDGQRIGRGSK